MIEYYIHPNSYHSGCEKNIIVITSISLLFSEVITFKNSAI